MRLRLLKQCLLSCRFQNGKGAGKHKLAVEIAGANSKAVKGFVFGLDAVTLGGGSEIARISTGRRLNGYGKIR